MRLFATVLAFSVCAVAASTQTASVTFNKDVLPILQKRCQDCHRPGEAAPMSLMTYSSTRPWAKAIKQAVASKKMPPWFADPQYGHFQNDRSLSQAEIDTITAWVDGGVKEGDIKDAPPARTFVEGWNIGKPDMVVEMPIAFSIPATGTVDYQYVVIPTNLKEDRWVVASEVRPSDRSVMHHVITTIREPGSGYMPDAKPGVVFVPGRNNRGGQASGGLTGYVPGASFAPEGTPRRATLLKAGSDIVFQLHYTTNGKPTMDKTKIGLVFAKEPPKEAVQGGNSASMNFTIPAGADNFQVVGTSTMQYDSKLISMMPHAHLRGKSFEYRATFPNGETQVLLKVPHYDFNWQLTYFPETPVALPKGTRVDVIAYFDNSVNNRFNPDATKEIHWGEQTWEEMMMGYFSVVVDAGQKVTNPGARRGASVPQALLNAPGVVQQ